MLPRPVIAVLAITLGLPFLVILALVSPASGVNTGFLTSVLTIVVLSAFITLMIFEIKRIADQPDEH